jgi:hypothetical protein
VKCHRSMGQSILFYIFCPNLSRHQPHIVWSQNSELSCVHHTLHSYHCESLKLICLVFTFTKTKIILFCATVISSITCCNLYKVLQLHVIVSFLGLLTIRYTFYQHVLTFLWLSNVKTVFLINFQLYSYCRIFTQYNYTKQLITQSYIVPHKYERQETLNVTTLSSCIVKPNCL